MNDLQNSYYDGLSVDILFSAIEEHLSTLKNVINAENFNIQESKDNIIQTLTLAEKQLSALRKKF